MAQDKARFPALPRRGLYKGVTPGGHPTVPTPHALHVAEQRLRQVARTHSHTADSGDTRDQGDLTRPLFPPPTDFYPRRPHSLRPDRNGVFALSLNQVTGSTPQEPGWISEPCKEMQTALWGAHGGPLGDGTVPTDFDLREMRQIIARLELKVRQATADARYSEKL